MNKLLFKMMIVIKIIHNKIFEILNNKIKNGNNGIILYR